MKITRKKQQQQQQQENKTKTIHTPRNAMIHGHSVADVIDFDNEEVKVNSLHKHPTEGNHEEVLHQGCYCYTGALKKTEEKL